MEQSQSGRAPIEVARDTEQLLDINKIEALAQEFSLPAEEVLSIALDVCGIRGGVAERVVLPYRYAGRDEITFKVVPGQNEHSPFNVENEQLCLGSVPVAELRGQTDDAALSGYFRRFTPDGLPTAMTFNPNSRSGCTGCAPCPTSLEEPADPRARNMEEIAASLHQAAADSPNGLETLRDLTISTGCFPTEQMAVDTVINTRRVLEEEFGLKGVTINYLSSEIRSDRAMAMLAEHAAPFTLIATIEHVTKRDLLLKASKAELQEDDFVDMAKRVRAHGHGFSYNYIVGIDPHEEMRRLSEKLEPYVEDVFPNYQVPQFEHNEVMRGLAIKQGPLSMLRHVLEARKIVEEVYADNPVLPEPWRNHRSLFPLNYRGEKLPHFEGMARNQKLKSRGRSLLSIVGINQAAPGACEAKPKPVRLPQRLVERLSETSLQDSFDALSPEDKKHILGILQDTYRHYGADVTDPAAKEAVKLRQRKLWDERFAQLVVPALVKR